MKQSIRWLSVAAYTVNSAQCTRTWLLSVCCYYYFYCYCYWLGLSVEKADSGW